MKTTWLRIALLTLLSLGSLVALSIDAPIKKPSAEQPATAVPAPTAPAPATPATPPATPPAAPAPAPATAPASDSRADEPTDADKKDPDGGFRPAQQSETQMELPPEMRGTADFDISFPIDI